MTRARVAWIVGMLTIGQGVAAAQEKEKAKEQGKARAPEVLLSVEGEVPVPLRLSAEAFARLPRRSVRVEDAHQGGALAEYQGTPLVEVLKAAGVKFGEDLRGPALATFLMVEAADGYRALFALPELDPACTDRVVLLADRRDGKPLDAREGPLRVIVVGEKRPARWVRQVVALRIGRG